MSRPIYAVQPSLSELAPHAAGFASLMIDAHRLDAPRLSTPAGHLT